MPATVENGGELRSPVKQQRQRRKGVVAVLAQGFRVKSTGEMAAERYGEQRRTQRQSRMQERLDADGRVPEVANNRPEKGF